MNDLTVTLTRDEWTMVLNVLANAPYRQVASLIDRIQQQAAAQAGGPPLPNGDAAHAPN